MGVDKRLKKKRARDHNDTTYIILKKKEEKKRKKRWLKLRDYWFAPGKGKAADLAPLMRRGRNWIFLGSKARGTIGF